jgi:hypothetical protein
VTVDADDDRKLLCKLIEQGGRKYTAQLRAGVSTNRRAWRSSIPCVPEGPKGNPAQWVLSGVSRRSRRGWIDAFL